MYKYDAMRHGMAQYAVRRDIKRSYAMSRIYKKVYLVYTRRMLRARNSFLSLVLCVLD